jgi:hypothetical protein
MMNISSEIRDGDISARSLKVQKIEEKRVSHGFLRQNTVFFQKPWQLFRFSSSQLIFAPKKSSYRLQYHPDAYSKPG